MSMTSHLLERVHKLVEVNQFDNARLVLDAVVRIEPENISAWLSYFQIYRNQNDLEWLKQRVINTIEISDENKQLLFEYHDYLLQYSYESTITEMNNGPIGISSTLPVLLDEKNNSQGMLFYNSNMSVKETDAPTLELLDIFSYPVLNSLSTHDENLKTSIESTVKPPHQAAFLLIVLFISIRLLAEGILIGQITLALFFIGAFYWLLKYAPTLNENNTQMRSYSFDNSYDLNLVNQSQIVESKITGTSNDLGDNYKSEQDDN